MEWYNWLLLGACLLIVISTIMKILFNHFFGHYICQLNRLSQMNIKKMFDEVSSYSLLEWDENRRYELMEYFLEYYFPHNIFYKYLEDRAKSELEELEWIEEESQLPHDKSVRLEQ